MKKQENFFNNDFQKYLRESAEEDSSFLVKFVQCATGSNYLPYDKTFKIYIEFNFGCRPDSLPMFHSCTREILCPGYKFFFSDYHKFKTMMNMVVNMVYNHFNMK
jgi:hypothetical protein